MYNNTMSKKEHLHFLGIAGHAIRGVALAAQKLGYEVSGTDETAYPPGSDWLNARDLRWWREADTAHLKTVDTLVLSGGSKPDHPLIEYALDRGLRVTSFAELAGQLAADKHRIAVSGTHGKTTTTSMIAWLLESAHRTPDFLIGIQPHNFDTSVRITDSPVMVFEADEYSSSQVDKQPKFNYYKPDVLIITSIEMDHPDVFKDLAEIKACFSRLARGVPSSGRILCWDGLVGAGEVLEHAVAPVERYGLSDGAEWRAVNIRFEPAGLRYVVQWKARVLGELFVPLYGLHNVLNSLAATAVAVGEGMSFEQIKTGFETFLGASRRFERVSEPGAAITIIDDYAHHPTEVAATIAAAKRHTDGRVLAIFRPHTHSRTQSLLAEYRLAFAEADEAWVVDIEGAREAHLEGTVSSKDIVDGAIGNVHYAPDRETLLADVKKAAMPGDIVLAMTVSGYDKLVNELNSLLN